MPELWKANSLSLQVGDRTNKKALYIIGAVVVFIAAFMMFFVMRQYFFDLSSSERNCDIKCNSAEPCKSICGFKNSLSATAKVILIFLFILIILGVYFVLVQNLPA